MSDRMSSIVPLFLIELVSSSLAAMCCLNLDEMSMSLVEFDHLACTRGSTFFRKLNPLVRAVLTQKEKLMKLCKWWLGWVALPSYVLQEPCDSVACQEQKRVSSSHRTTTTAVCCAVVNRQRRHRSRRMPCNMWFDSFSLPSYLTGTQISLTQQLEIRQLNSVMNRDSGVQIIVTEAAAADSAADSAEAATCPSLTTTVHPEPNGNDTPTVQPELAVPQPRGRRKLSVVEFSSVVMSTRDDDDESKTDCGPITTALDTEETVVEHRTSTSSRSQVSALNSTKSIRHKHQTDRTTRMLVAVLVLFLVTEIPQGIMALLSGVLGRKFFTGCYTKGMGEILDLLALLNSAINFLLYCSMSRQFRRAARTQFRRLFGMLTGLEECSNGGSPTSNCFFRPKYLTQPQPINISPSNPTRCTQLWNSFPFTIHTYLYIYIFCIDILVSSRCWLFYLFFLWQSYTASYIIIQNDQR